MRCVLGERRGRGEDERAIFLFFFFFVTKNECEFIVSWIRVLSELESLGGNLRRQLVPVQSAFSSFALCSSASRRGASGGLRQDSRTPRTWSRRGGEAGPG